MADTTAGCPWPINTSCIPADWLTFSPELREYAVGLASSTLHALTAGRVGGCPIVVRPCKPTGALLPAYGLYGPGAPLYSPGITAAGVWVNSCGCDSGCSCTASCSIELPAPVGPVYSIKIDGVEQVLTDFRIDNGNTLVYQGDLADGCPFPASQDLRLLDTEVGTWSVTYLNAAEVDAAGQRAAAQLAYEFALACGAAGTKAKCRLPSNVVSVVRTGVTLTLNTGIWPEGTTGIREVDAWIYLYNPQGRTTQARVLSLDTAEPYLQGRTIPAWDSDVTGVVLDGGTF